MDATPIPAAPRETFGLAARGRAAPAAIAGFGRPGARMSGDGGHLTAHRFGAGHRVCAKFIGEKPAGYQPAARCSQNSSQRPLSWEQRRAIIALAWLTVQRIPDCFSRCPMIVLQPASTTPEPTKRPWLRNWA